MKLFFLFWLKKTFLTDISQDYSSHLPLYVQIENLLRMEIKKRDNGRVKV